MKDTNYYSVQGWMVNKLHLSGNELICYAIIYGFSQEGMSVFMGSLSYLEKWMNATRPTVIKALKSLVEKSLIIKQEVEKNKVRLCYYGINEETKESLLVGSKETLSGGDKETLSNNIKDTSIVDRLSKEYNKHQTDELYKAAMNVIVRANRERFEEATDMCEALREIWAEDIERARDEVKEVERNESIRRMIVSCKDLGVSLEQIQETLVKNYELTEKQAEEYVAKYW